MRRKVYNDQSMLVFPDHLRGDWSSVLGSARTGLISTGIQLGGGS